RFPRAHEFGCVSGHPKAASEERLKTAHCELSVHELYAEGFPSVETTMANQISMSQKQSIAALHRQGVSDLPIPALMDFHRGLVTGHLSR
ncbi:MAG: hypothetical protein ACKOJF_30585, partial [Planctomycetaceae bacterium]